MAKSEGNDQPGDLYTDKNTGYGVDAPLTYQSGPKQTGCGLSQQPGYPLQQPGYVQLPYTNTSTTVVVNQPQTGKVIIKARHKDYLSASIFACLCCFWPTGICAIYYANEANNLAGVGDYEGSRRMSDNARKLVITSVILGIIAITLSVVLRIVLFKNKCEY
ncbi:trafficking regulator of GLUT4 1-like isoform X4 [Mercenaria mercenaria]|uniref:trafficking regulator of GLUT4 1-like isoform X4 n=1 Tax=Mercenaria mercenaria TaxID=6596 RepID=UPI00234EA83C|nr:trafficking regulator of GLUT4 1-like isoform X4 [Mercenaria mercenaria]